MYRGQRLSVLLVAIIVIIALLAGCSGNPPSRTLPDINPPGPGPQPPVVGTATIQATVVDATNVGAAIEGALVAVVGTAINGLSDAQGALTLTGVSDGWATLDVSFPSTGAYQATQLVVETVANAVTQVTIAAVPTSQTPPNSVILSPANETIDIGGQVQFTADVRAYGAPVSLMPSLSLVGDIGTLLPSGLFVATQMGTGEVTAHVEGATDTSTLQVVASRPPRLGTFSVSPTSLPPEGSDLPPVGIIDPNDIPVRISIAATDGDGIQTMTAEIERPNRSLMTLPLALEGGTARDGSWGGSYYAPPNNNPFDSSGTQLPQTYSVRVVARDASNAVTYSDWTDFEVAGLEAPPVPPDE
jgi:hypothetical protein